MAALASSASVQFNTFLYFKDRQNEIEEAIIMKITKAGVYVLVQKYGIEGLLNDPDHILEVYPEKEEARINGTVVKTFDHLRLNIVAKSIEFRRSIVLNYIEKLETN